MLFTGELVVALVVGAFWLLGCVLLYFRPVRVYMDGPGQRLHVRRANSVHIQGASPEFPTLKSAGSFYVRGSAELPALSDLHTLNVSGSGSVSMAKPEHTLDFLKCTDQPRDTDQAGAPDDHS